MRILYVTAHYPPDFVSGATLQVQRLAERAAAMGHGVTVFSGAIDAGLADGAGRADRVNGVDVRWIGTAGLIEQDDDRNWRNPAATAAVAHLLDEVAPDVVHAHTLQTLGTGPLTEAARRSVRTIVTMHDLWWWCSRLFLVDRDLRPCPLVVDASDCACARTAAWRRDRADALLPALREVSEILVPSRAMRDLVVANGISPDRVSVDENDVAADLHGQLDNATPTFSAHLPTTVGGKRTENPTWRDSRRERVAGNPVRFVYMGGDNPLKGADVMLDAARRLRGLAGWMLTTYGMSVERRRSSRSDDPITFMPAFRPSDTGAILGAGDVLVIPSLARESYSIAAREGLGAGMAVLTSDCLGPEEVVRDGVNGLVVPTGDAVALSEAMRGLVEQPAELDGLLRGAAATTVSWRGPDDHVSDLLARYGSPRREPSPTPPGRVIIVVGEADRYGMSRTTNGVEVARPSRPARLREALSLHGVAVEVVDDRRPDLTTAVADADVVIVTNAASAARTALDPRPPNTTVIYDAGDATDGHERHAWCDAAIASRRAVANAVARTTGLTATVVADALGVGELRAAMAPTTRPRRHPLLRRWNRRPARIVIAVMATGDTAGGTTGAAPCPTSPRAVELLGAPPGSEVISLEGSWRTRIGRLRQSDIVVVPSPAPVDSDPAWLVASWMHAAAAGKPTIVDATTELATSGEIEPIVDDGRTGLLVRDRDDWARQVRRLAGNPSERAIIAAAARRSVALHHGPHVTAHVLLAALAALAPSPGAGSDGSLTG